MKIRYLSGIGLIAVAVLSFMHMNAVGKDDGVSVFSQKFLSKLTNCSPYTEIIEPMQGIKIKNQVGGKSNGKCKFVYMDNTTCYLTPAQIKTITDGAKGIGPTSYTSNNNGTRMSVDSDPLSIALTKLFNDSSVCTHKDD